VALSEGKVTQKTDIELVRRTAELARSSPTAWSAFVAEFRKYADRIKDQCVASPIVDLPVRQGIARGVVGDLILFETCVVEADRLAASNVK